MTGKYDVTGPEAEFEPGSRGRVLRNLLGITRVRDVNEAESQALELAWEAALDRYGPDHNVTANELCALQRLWLGPIYPWAGEYRGVNIGKDGFQFAHAPLIAEPQALPYQTQINKALREVMTRPQHSVQQALLQDKQFIAKLAKVIKQVA